MSKGLKGKLVLAISSRALFDLSDSHQVYLTQGIEAYRQYQIEHEDEVLTPGDAFALVKKLLSFNVSLGRERVEVVLVSQQCRHRAAAKPASRALRTSSAWVDKNKSQPNALR